MDRRGISLLVCCALVLGLEARCYYMGIKYVVGQKFELGGCLKCECQDSGMVSCLPDCPPVQFQCDDGAEPVREFGACCPSCPGPLPTYEIPVSGTPDSAIS